MQPRDAYTSAVGCSGDRYAKAGYRLSDTLLAGSRLVGPDRVSICETGSSICVHYSHYTVVMSVSPLEQRAPLACNIAFANRLSSMGKKKTKK